MHGRAEAVQARARHQATNGRVRVGLIGCGKMGIHHLKAIAATGKGIVVGVADPAATEESVQELRSLMAPDAKVVATAAELLEQIRPDVVHIVTPPGTHAALAEQALRAGSHVYVEKPFTPTKAEAERIFALAAERGLKVCAGHQVQFEPPALAALDALSDIGRVVHIESYFSFKMVRRTITAVEQVKDILPHAVYPVVDQLRAATGLLDESPTLTGLSVDPSGDVYALVRLGRATAVVLVTLNGRPVEHYQQIVGTNGSMRADYIAGSLTKLVGPGTGPGVLLTPFRRSYRTMTGATRGIAKLIFRRGASYPGLITLIGRFYGSILENTAPPLTPRSILDTVGICEEVGAALDEAERAYESRARAALQDAETLLPAVRAGEPVALVTGGTGLLGRA
ncbi:MAG TPA: Gfo/Idh/MocA family oxidoreductase, partial [Vicinamibacterales bacterium]|nr:Gfo/Idh/MocA family oxidoreductase [Vicinamibacterales bacterium]